MKRKLLFIINPISGINDKNKTRKIIEKHVCTSGCEYEIVFTKYPRHAFELSRTAVEENLDAVIIAGGDGSVNEVASALVNTPVKLGIIPNGSGNGLARHLGIPLDAAKSMVIINRFSPKKIDTYILNGHFGCNLAGIGFDAKVANEFAREKRRGFFSYVKTALINFPKYKPVRFSILSGNVKIETDAFLISIANSNQFGNRAVIAPHAKPDDSILDICIVKPFLLWYAPVFAIALLTNRANRTGFISYIAAQSAIITASRPTEIHIDGDPLPPEKVVEVKINPLSLAVLV